MSKEIALPYSGLPKEKQEEIREILFTQYDKRIDIGDWIVDESYGLDGQVVNIRLVEKKRWLKTKTEEGRDFEMYDDVVVDYIREEGGSKSTLDSQYFKGHYFWKGTKEELLESAKKISNGELPDISTPKSNIETGVMTFNKDSFVALKEDMILKMESANASMAISKRELELMRYKLREMLEPMLAEIKRITTIIWTIELYLGINENIMSVAQGPLAPEDEPIHLMQERLYIDEEVGDPSDDGVDFRSMERFYDWMDTHNKYFGYKNRDLLLPYPKCVRTMRIRREEKEYSSNPFTNSIMNEANFETVILIRNGETTYSIETDMRFGSKLFPNEDELMKLSMEIRNESDEDRYRNKPTEKDLTDKIDRYKRNFIIMQGLIDRTEVFGKLFGKVNLMNGSAIDKGQVIFEYDVDKSSQIGDGDYSWNQRMRLMDEQIGAGSRVLWFGKSGYGTRAEQGSYRFFRIFSWRDNYPEWPRSSGPYDLLWDEKERCHYFMFAEGEVWDEDAGDYRTRKKRSAFRVDKNELYDLDFLSWRDMDWLEKMMYDRRERRGYLTKMKVLMQIKSFKEAELKLEEPFALLIQGQCQVTREEALDAIHWWKTKNKYKRALTEDDSKALRMIKKHLKKDQ